MFLWSAVCMISEWKNFSKNKWITLAPTPSDVSWADTAARLWSLAHCNRGDRRWGEGPAVAPSTLAPHFGVGWGSGAAPLGVRMLMHCLPVEDKVLTFHKMCRNSIVSWFFGRTGSFPPQRLFWGLFSLQPFSSQGFFCKAFGWVKGTGLDSACSMGYTCLTVCAERHLNPP